MARVSDITETVADTARDPFSAHTTGLPDRSRTDEAELRDGDAIELSAGPIGAAAAFIVRNPRRMRRQSRRASASAAAAWRLL